MKTRNTEKLRTILGSKQKQNKKILLKLHEKVKDKIGCNKRIDLGKGLNLGKPLEFGNKIDLGKELNFGKELEY